MTPDDPNNTWIDPKCVQCEGTEIDQKHWQQHEAVPITGQQRKKQSSNTCNFFLHFTVHTLRLTGLSLPDLKFTQQTIQMAQ